MVLASSLTTQERGNHCHPAEVESKLCPLTALLTYTLPLAGKRNMVSGEGSILVTFPPIPYCNPGPYSGHEVKIIYQSYRQNLETLRTAHHPMVVTDYYRDYYIHGYICLGSSIRF